MNASLCSIFLAASVQAVTAQTLEGPTPENQKVEAPVRATPMRGELIEISSCAGGPPITLAAADARALLDDEERESLLAEMVARYPVLERDGFAAPAIILWRKGAKDWLYVSLRPNGFTNDVLCFTATFVAGIFQITPALTSKYFFEAGSHS